MEMTKASYAKMLLGLKKARLKAIMKMIEGREMRGEKIGYYTLTYLECELELVKEEIDYLIQLSNN